MEINSIEMERNRLHAMNQISTNEKLIQNRSSLNPLSWLALLNITIVALFYYLNPFMFIHTYRFGPKKKSIEL